jgi:hypothetical protein
MDGPGGFIWLTVKECESMLHCCSGDYECCNVVASGDREEY